MVPTNSRQFPTRRRLRSWSAVQRPYATGSRRTIANAAIVEGFFGFLWFGWGRAGAPPWASIVLDIGAALAALLAIAGVVYARQVRHDPPPLADPAAGRRIRIIWGIEFGAIAAGWVILAATGQQEFIAAWVCFVVGVHFVPLDRVFPGIGLVGLGIAVTLVAVAAFIVGVSTTTLPSTVAGLGTGAFLLVHGTSLLIAARRHQAGHRGDPDASIA